AVFLRPPLPIQRNQPNWPLLAVSKSFFEVAGQARAAAEGSGSAVAAALDEPLEAAGAWGDDDVLPDHKEEGEEEIMEDACEDGGWDVGDEDL
ncbi:hypothetical protein NL387_26690, partial [Klebsiella pneumoniae]|nr:hypothetical protein [Klebsiella pneumoniae]